MVRKKHVVGRRVLSILLCMLIVLCTVPMIAIAAADGAGVKVIERSKPLLYVYRNIAERYQPEAVKTQTPLSSYPLVVTGAVLRMATEQGGWDQTGTYKHTVLKAEWVNADKSFEEPGTYTEPIRIAHTTDETIWAIVEYTFTVEQASSVAPAEITKMPEIAPIVFKENLTVSELALSGGEANVPGTFSFTNPEQKLSAGEYQISVTFTPDDAAAALPVTVKVPVEVAKGTISVLSVPVITIEYGTKLKDVSLGNFSELETIPSSGVSWGWTGVGGAAGSLSDPRADQVLAVGTYDDILVRAYTIYNNNYAETFIPVKVVVNPVSKEFPMLCEMDEAARRIIVTGRGNSDAKGAVTYTLHSDALAEDLVIEGKGVQDVATFQLDDNAKSGAYTVTATYTPGANDPCAYASAAKQLDVRFVHTVTVVGGRAINGDACQTGDTVHIRIDAESIKKNYEFKSWKITNANGDTIDVGVEDLTQRDISFVMPDEAVKVEAQASFSIQLFFENLGNSILSFIMKIVEWFQGIFNGLGALS